jgi:PPOX class probable F420-dependent enzyme
MEPTDMRTRFAAARVARMATVDREQRPHLVPVCFAVDGETIVSAVDAKPKSTVALRRLANISAHPAVSLLVDHYDEDWSQLWWVRVDGVGAVVGTGRDRDTAIDLLATKYEQYRQQAPIGAVVVITAERWRGWSAR